MSAKWFIKGHDAPLTAAQLKSLAAKGQVAPDTLLRKGEGGKWAKAKQVKGLMFADAAQSSERGNEHSAQSSGNSPNDLGDLIDDELRAAELPSSPQPTSECPNCRKSNLVSNRFCSRCGLVFETGETKPELIDVAELPSEPGGDACPKCGSARIRKAFAYEVKEFREANGLSFLPPRYCFDCSHMWAPKSKPRHPIIAGVIFLGLFAVLCAIAPEVEDASLFNLMDWIDGSLAKFWFFLLLFPSSFFFGVAWTAWGLWRVFVNKEKI